MLYMRGPLVLLIALSALSGCIEEGADLGVEVTPRELLGIPDHFELPAIPEANPLSGEKVALGRHLFYDRRLSANGTQSCADCHHQSRAFADGEVTPTGSTGSVLARNSQGLSNVAYNASLTWASDGLLTLEEQILVPILSDNPVELGVHDGVREEVLARFDDDPTYARMFAEAFPESESGATINKVAFALAHFCRSMISADSVYDEWLRGDRAALTEQQNLGRALFFGERFECFHCHNGVQLTVAYRDANTRENNARFFNNGLYNVDGEGGYPAHDQGLFELTSNPNHRGLFRPPGLRNVALTGPYMHDGSIPTLRGVVEHYAAGGRLTEEGPFAGDGRLSPLKSGLVRGFVATDEELDAVVAFLESFTDEVFITNPALSDPFVEQ